MFTGIIEEMGEVISVTRSANLSVLEIKGLKVVRGVKIGDSIAVDGVCLTVTTLNGTRLRFDVMRETLDKTTLGNKRAGSKVNLERALRMRGRIDGHFVSGHVDNMGLVKERITQKNYLEFRIGLSKNLMRYIVPKGSVTVDGVSLTVGDVRKGWFAVYLIPHTCDMTTLGRLRKGSRVNIETDILAKYVLNQPTPKRL